MTTPYAIFFYFASPFRKYLYFFFSMAYKSGMASRRNDYNERQIELAAPRAQKIVRLRDAGATWKAIGQQFRISHARAQQIYAKAHVRISPGATPKK